MGERYVEDEPAFLAPLWHRWEQMFELLNLSLYTAGGGTVPVEMLLEITLDAPVGMLGFAPYANPGPAGRRAWHAHLVDALAALESLGAIRTETSDDPAVDAKIREISARTDPDLTLAALTPIGLWAYRRWLVEQGVPAPTVGELVDADLSELYEGLTMASPEVLDAELTSWVAHRGAAQAATEVEAFLRSAHEPAERLFALPVLGLAGEHGTTAALSLRAAGGITGSVVTGWLLETGAIDPADVGPEEVLLGMVDELSALVDEGFVAEAFAGQSVSDQVSMIAACGRIDHPRLRDVLGAVAEAPLDRKVAKAARKALLRLRV